jgi:hypothetical protein
MLPSDAKQLQCHPVQPSSQSWQHNRKADVEEQRHVSLAVRQQSQDCKAGFPGSLWRASYCSVMPRQRKSMRYITRK